MSIPDYLLSSKELEALSNEIRGCRHNSERVRLLCVYWIGQEKEVEWVSQFLLIDRRTVYRYVEDYHKRNKKTPGDRGGSDPHLKSEEEEILKKHLNKNILSSTQAVVVYVEETFGVIYSRGGMAKLLKRLGFRYKRPHRVPRTVDVDEQEKFVERYRKMKSVLKKDEVILFMDGVHPDHQTQAVCGWIQVGINAQVPSTGKQKRVHYLGAVEIKQDDVVHTVCSYDSIQTEAVIDFLGKLKERYPGKKLTIICDRGPYHTSKKTRAFWEPDPLINLIYLPPRCPNLNLIERLWKILREHVTHNQYYERFANFKEAVANFFERTIYKIKDAVVKRLRDNFQIIRPSFVTD